MSNFEHSYALVIGINNYNNGISALKTAVSDATEIAHLLETKHHYTVNLLVNEAATISQLRQVLETELPKQIQKSDRFLFYFAGHGIALNGEDGPEGYLIPQDAQLGNVSTYLPMPELNKALLELSCRHFLGILDCCFAGAFRWSSTRKAIPCELVTIHKERYDRFIQDPAWQVITSAAYDQTAFDAFDLKDDRGEKGVHSPFACALIEALEGKADAFPPAETGKPAGDGVITADELYLYLRDRVEIATEARAIRQTPGIHCLNKHDKGEYIFLAPGHQLNLPPAPPLDVAKNPYRGLSPFEEEHCDLFFGRKALTQKLYEFVTSHALTVVLGASGSGKSSLVKAGVIPKLRQYQDSNSWFILPPFRPGESPFKALNNVLVSVNLPAIATANEATSLGLLTPIESLANWFKEHPQSNLLLIVDQFEELITLCRNDEERQQFLETLKEAIATYPHQLHLILTVRSDFEPQFRNTVLEKDWQTARFIVPAMTREELRQAIEEPASARVMYFDPHELVEQLIDEVANMPGALPLLSFALSELYLKYLKRQEDAKNRGETIDRAITRADYEELGGVTRSLTQRADQEYEALVKQDPAYAQTIRNVMLRMVAVGGELARRRVPLSELEYPEPENRRVKKVIQQFLAARLLVSGADADEQSYVEPAHDVLVRGWQRLSDWKKKEQENLILQRGLTPAAQEWRSKQQARLLWNANPRLDLLKQAMNSADNWLNKTEEEFVRYSVRQKRKNVTVRWGLVTLAFISLIGFTSFIYIQGLIAQIRASNASSKALSLADRELVALQESLIAGKKLKRLKQLWSVDTETQLQTAIALVQAISGVREYNQLKGDTSINDIQFSKDGRVLAGAGEDGTIKLWALATNEVKTLKGHNAKITDINFSPDNHTFVSASRDGTIKHWTLEGTLLRTIQTDAIDNVSFSPNGQKIVSNHNLKLRIWGLDGKLLQTIEHGIDIYNEWLEDHLEARKKLLDFWQSNRNLSHDFSVDRGGVNRVVLSPNGQILATISGLKSTLYLWSSKDGKLLRSISDLITDASEPTDGIFIVKFSPDSKKIAVANNSSTIQVWSVDGKLLDTLNGHRDLITGLSFSSDGQTLASSSRDRAIKLWRLERNNLITLSKPNTRYSFFTFSPDSQIIAACGGNKDREFVTLWTKDGKWLKNFQNSCYVAFSPDSQIAAFYSETNTQLWHRSSGLIQSLEGKFEKFSPNGKMIATTVSSLKPTIKLWANDGGFIGSIEGKHAHFMLDNQRIISTTDDGKIKLWDFNGKQLNSSNYNGLGSDVIFSPDSQVIAIPSVSNNSTQLRTINGELIDTLNGHSGSFSPDGQLIATYESSEYTGGAVILWDRDGKKLKSLPSSSGMTSIKFSPDSQFITASDLDRTTFWNRNGELLLTIAGRFAFSSDSRTIFSASTSDVKIWNRNGTLLENIPQNERVQYFNISPDGQILALADATGKIVLWNLDLDSLLNRGCRWLYDYLNNSNANFSSENPELNNFCSTPNLR